MKENDTAVLNFKLSFDVFLHLWELTGEIRDKEEIPSVRDCGEWGNSNPFYRKKY